MKSPHHQIALSIPLFMAMAACGDPGIPLALEDALTLEAVISPQARDRTCTFKHNPLPEIVRCSRDGLFLHLRGSNPPCRTLDGSDVLFTVDGHPAEIIEPGGADPNGGCRSMVVGMATEYPYPKLSGTDVDEGAPPVFEAIEGEASLRIRLAPTAIEASGDLWLMGRQGLDESGAYYLASIPNGDFVDLGADGHYAVEMDLASLGLLPASLSHVESARFLLDDGTSFGSPQLALDESGSGRFSLDFGSIYSEGNHQGTLHLRVGVREADYPRFAECIGVASCAMEGMGPSLRIAQAATLSSSLPAGGALGACYPNQTCNTGLACTPDGCGVEY